MNKAVSRIFEIYVLAFVVLFASRPLRDADFWWHLKTGEFITRNSIVPRSDFFSFTNYGKPWVAHEWLSEVIFYVVYSRFGFNALILIFAVLTGLAFWITLRRSHASLIIRGFAVLLGVWTVIPTIGVRPRVFTLLFASVYLALLTRYARGNNGRAIWWLVPLMVLWVNLHGGFLIGLVLILLVATGMFLDHWFSGDSVDLQWRSLKVLGLVFLGCSIAALLNPQGWRIYLFPFEIFLSSIQQREVADWLSPDFHKPELLPLALLILVSIAAISLSPRRVRPSELLLFLTTLFATLKSNRHMAIFALVAVPILSDYLQHWLSSIDRGNTFVANLTRAAGRWKVMTGILLLIPLLVLAARAKSVVYAPPSQTLIRVPVNAVEFMKARGIVGNTFTDPNMWSGYLIWEMPLNPVYIDGRIDMYGDQFVQEYVDIIRGRVDWRGPFERYDVRIVMVAPASMLARELQNSSAWNMLYRDDMAVVYNRR